VFCVRVRECVCMYAVKLGIQSGCRISVVAGMRHWKLAASVSVEILATEFIRENIENLIRKKNESYAVFGIFKGDHPSMAFHAVAKGVFSD
jgi:hypothetical protein